MKTIKNDNITTSHDLDTLLTDESSVAIARAILDLSLILGQSNVEKFLVDRLASISTAKDAEKKRQDIIDNINRNILQLVKLGVTSHIRKHSRLDIDASPCGDAPNLDDEITDYYCFYFEAAVKERRTEDEFTLIGNLTDSIADCFEHNCSEITFTVFFYGNDISDEDYCDDARSLYGLTIPSLTDFNQDQLTQIYDVLIPRLFILGVKAANDLADVLI